MKKLFSIITQLEQKQPLTIWKLLLVLLFIIFIPHLIISYNIANESLMTDLRSRIVGSRSLHQGFSPYFYQWRPQDDVRLYNLNMQKPYGVNGLTSTPILLWMQLPFSELNYCTIKVLWWVIEEFFLLGTIFFVCAATSTLWKQLLTICITSIFFVYSRNWWYHIYSGQYYILFGFTFSVCVYLASRKPKLPLILFPVAALLRPFFALATLPFLLKNFTENMKWLAGGACISLILLFVSGTYKLMPDYNKAMKIYSKEIINGPQQVPATNNSNIALEDCFQTVTTSASGAGCLFSVQHYLKLFGVKLSDPYLFLTMLSVVVVLFVWMFGYKKITSNNTNTLLASFVIYILCELFTPANRNPYNLIQYLAITGLLINCGSYKLILVYVVGLLLNHDFPVRLAYQRELGEALMLLSIFLKLLQAKVNSNYSTESETVSQIA